MQEATTYFSTIAQIGGALLGLVFIATSFNDRILADGGNPALRGLAHQTFADLLAVLAVALLMLFPIRFNFGPALVTIALLGALRVTRGLIMAIESAGLRQTLVFLRYGLSSCGYAGLFYAGVLVCGDSDPQVSQVFVAASPLILLLSGSRSAWILFIHKS